VFAGVGSFKILQHKARKGRNPRTGNKIQIPASKVVKFTAGKALKESVEALPAPALACSRCISGA